MPKSRPQPPRPDRRRSIRGSFSWIDHRFLRERFDQGLTRLEKLFYFVPVATRHLQEMYRRQLSDEKTSRRLQRLDKRLLKVVSQLQTLKPEQN